MKLQRLWRPHHPLFWLMLAFNALSSLGAWGLRVLPWSSAALTALGAVSLLNAVFGMVLAWRLLHLPRDDEAQPPERSP